MGIQFAVSRARRRVDAFGSGPIGTGDVARYIQERVASDVYGFDQIVDLRAAEFLADAAAVRRAVLEERQQRQLGPVPHTALVATPGTPTHGTASELAASFSADGASVAVFSTLVRAEVWLEHTRAAMQPAARKREK
jgi:hypothetical protein